MSFSGQPRFPNMLTCCTEQYNRRRTLLLLPWKQKLGQQGAWVVSSHVGSPKPWVSIHLNGPIWDEVWIPPWLRKPHDLHWFSIIDTKYGWFSLISEVARTFSQQPGSLASVASWPEFLTVVFAACSILSLLFRSWWRTYHSAGWCIWIPLLDYYSPQCIW